ncbi:MAG: kdgA [Rhodoglobus sp.]|nr:kdgA [Rhodoglobus sp.]
MTHDALAAMTQDRCIAIVRAPRIPDAAALATAIAAGGIRCVEFTFTTPGVEQHIVAATGTPAIVGAGTVTTADQARAAIDAGARFIVTPAVVESVAQVVTRAGVPLVMGAMTPTEVMRALDLGADVVKIFPADVVGPAHFSNLLGPFPGVRLMASGGVNEANARQFIAAGAVSVAAGSSVVSAAMVESGDWVSITRRAEAFVSVIREV